MSREKGMNDRKAYPNAVVSDRKQALNRLDHAILQDRKTTEVKIAREVASATALPMSPTPICELISGFLTRPILSTLHEAARDLSRLGLVPTFLQTYEELFDARASDKMVVYFLR